MHPEDQRIIEITRELCQQLNWYKFNPQTINWRERMGVRRLPLDFFMIVSRGIFAGTMQLSKRAMGKLTPEEWRPFIASALIYYKNSNREILRAFLPLMIFMAGVFPVTLALSFRFLSGLGGTSYTIGVLVVNALLFTLLGWGFLHFFSRQKKLWFKADDQASQLLGRESVLSSFRKLASIGQLEGTGRKGFIRPSLDERINHLNVSSGASWGQFPSI